MSCNIFHLWSSKNKTNFNWFCYFPVIFSFAELESKCVLEQCGVGQYVLSVDNKYYTAKIELRIVNNLPIEIPVEKIEGLIIYQNIQNVM